MPNNNHSSKINFNCNNMIDPIKKIILKHPKTAFINQEKINEEFNALNFTEAPNFNESINEYDSFMKILDSFGIEKYFLKKNESTSIDSIYTHDPLVITNNGAVLCNMGKVNRVSESKAIREFLIELKIPILGEITAPGKLEGGDIVWINKRTIAVGTGYRTNNEGIKQLKQILSNTVERIISVPLPHWKGPNDCLHLMSNLSPVDSDLFLSYSRLLPVQFLEELQNYNIELIDVPDKEYYTMGCNVLAVSPRKAVMLKGNPLTKKKLEAKNVEVFTYKGCEISLKGSGGPTCLTKPFLRISGEI
jgi:arginine deiminase